MYLPRYAQRARLPTLYQVPPRTRLHCLSFFINFHKEWGKTITKTDAEVPVAGIDPEAICATGVPGIAKPSAPTNSFEFHFLAFLLSFKTTTKTDEVTPVVGREPDAIRATGEPVNVVPSAPTNLFKFHFSSLSFLIFTKSGEKQQRKPTLPSR